MKFIVTATGINGHTYGCTFDLKNAITAKVYFYAICFMGRISEEGRNVACDEVSRIVETAGLTDDELVARLAEDDILGEP